MKLLPYAAVLLLLVFLAVLQFRGADEPPQPRFGLRIERIIVEETQPRAATMPPLVSTPECPAGHILNTSPSGAPCIMIRPTAINPPPHP